MNTDSERQGVMRALAIGGAISIVGVAASTVFGWLRIKGLAVTLGPSGFGVYGQIWVFVLYTGSFAAAGIGVGMTKFVASERERRDTVALSALASTALTLPLLAGGLLGLLTLGVSAALAPLLTGSDQVSLVWLAALSIPLVGIQMTFQPLLQGFEDAKGQAAIFAAYGASFALLSIGGALLLGVWGAVAALLCGNLVLASLYLYRGRELLTMAGGALRIARRRARKFARPLLAIGSGALLGLIVFSISDLAVRIAVLHYDGKEALGFWVALMTLSVQFLGAISSAVVFFTAPMTARAAAREDTEAVRTVVDDSLRLSTLAVAPLIGLVLTFRDPIVSVLFSDEFDGMAAYLPAQMTGDLLRAFAWPLGLCLVPLGFIRVWVLSGVGASGLYGLAGVYLTHRLGLEGAVASYVLLWATLLVVVATWLVAKRVWWPTRQSALGVLVSALMLAIVTVAQGAIGLVILIAGTALLVFASTTRSERSAFFDRIFRRPLKLRR